MSGKVNMAGNTPHRRYNALTGEWVQVSPQRTQRPWQGQLERAAGPERPAYDPGCYLCPGNARAGGRRNPPYTGTFVFPNDFPSLLPETPQQEEAAHPLLRSRSAPGECRVICFSPRHDLTLAEMAVEDICQVVEVWAEQTAELRQKYRWVQVFENKGAIMGCSNPRPHGQIWSLDDLPNEPAKEERCQREYFERYGRSLLLDYAELELERGERVVLANLRDNVQSWTLRPDGEYERFKPDKERFSAHHFFLTNPSLSGRGSALYPELLKSKHKKYKKKKNKEG
jgi:UDPglucose--hexose-1-phosphate uridylyltransferase